MSDFSKRENVLSFQGWFPSQEENPENIGISFNKFDCGTSVFIVWTLSIYFEKRGWKRRCNIRSMPESSRKDARIAFSKKKKKETTQYKDECFMIYF